MTKQEWLKKLKNDQVNRMGLGMYVLDSFNEEISECLAEHDAAFNVYIEKAKVLDKILDYFNNDDSYNKNKVFTRQVYDVINKLKTI